MSGVPRWLAVTAAVAAIIAVPIALLQLTDDDDTSISGPTTDGSTITGVGPGTGTEPPPVDATTSPTPAPQPATVGLTQLDDQQDVQFSVDADFSTRNIAGTDYTDAVTGLVYSDNSGFDHLMIETKGRFTRMAFTVGIDSEAECPQARAQVSVQDQSGTYLWGPRTVDILSPRSAKIAIPSPVQVALVQTSLTGENACGNGEAQVSWGSVVFSA